MFNANYFTYAGVNSGEYNLRIAELDSANTVETLVLSPTIKTVKPSGAHRFFNVCVEYEEAPEYQLSIISERPIQEQFRREILTWLVGRRDYQKLVIHQPDLQNYHYNCIFKDANIIFINGRCHGFVVTAQFDSPYQYGAPKKISVMGDGIAEKEVSIVNESDICDDYVYPEIKFVAGALSNESETITLSIKNVTDEAIINTSREFRLENIPAGNEGTIDNELKIIKGNGIGFTQFNMNWLRLVQGKNKLKIKFNGTVEIICPTYAKIGF